MKKGTDLDPFLTNKSTPQLSNDNTSYPWVRYIVAALATASIFGLIVLILLLAVPITVLAIGGTYRDPRYCPIEPRISLFLIVNGSVTLGSIILTIIISIMTIWFAYQSSLASIILVIILIITIFISTIFSFIWLIIGSVWTFSVRNTVLHEYDTFTNFYSYNYCHPVLYKFTFAYLVLTYIFLALQCCFYCSPNILRCRKQKNSFGVITE